MNSSGKSALQTIVIGGGLAGLSAACTLAARGHAVTLLERNPWLGGKAAVLDGDGFHFDMGPTILTVPEVLSRVFTEAGRKLTDYLDLIPLDPQWRCFFQDRSVLDLHADVSKMIATLDAYAPSSGSGKRYQDFMALSARLEGISDRFFFWRPIGSIRDMFSLGDFFSTGTLGDVLSMRMGSTVAATIRKFAPNPNIAQMLDHFVQYVGSAPDQSPAVLCGIAHMQTGRGVWYPRGGTAAIPAALAKLAQELGVTIRTGMQVAHIDNQNGRVTGVQLENGETIACDAVVSNMDSLRTFRELIGGPVAAAFERSRRFEPACSGVVLYLGLKKAYEHILHHNFVFSRDPHEEFDAIYRRGEPAPDPTCYVCAPARTEPNVAPPCGEALYVLVHTPYLRPHHDWTAMLPRYRQVIFDKLKDTAGITDIEERIVFERALTPQDIHERYQVLNGAIYGLASHGRFFGAFKPSNRSRQVKGLYLAGGAAHPGPGMPMVLMSGWIAADALDGDLAGVATPQEGEPIAG
jgi:phytoene desaturase